MTTNAQRLQDFVHFVQDKLKGDEKGESQIFLDKFFRAFGHEGAVEAGAVYEERIKKGSKAGKTGYADLVWKPRVLIEMKKRGTDLAKHYSQAFDYWQRAVPDRPRYVLLCNFDEFWVYDFDTQIDTPIDMVALKQLPDRVAVFGFMEVTERKSVFGNNQVEVTEKAAGRMGELYAMLRDRLLRQGLPPSPLAPLPGGAGNRKAPSPQGEGVGDEGRAALTAQRFVLQSVLAMFAEDRALLPDSLFVQSVQDCLGGESSYDVLGNLFSAMNSPGMTPAGRFKGVDYFNGGLFAHIDPIDLTQPELKLLEVAALENWSKVRPAIFGSIFESAIDAKTRHAHGIHYTAEADIMKIVRPTISRYWEERIDQASTIGELNALQLELQNYRVLDPACGSGNFLYIAYQELKQIEQKLLDKIAERRKSPREQLQMGFVTPNQFFGIDNNPFAVELARVTLMIARKVAIDRLGLQDYEPALPLDTLDQNIVCKDALFTEWPKADAIIGNPPFLGGKHMRINLGDNYIDRVFKRFPDVKDSVDFCAYWFRLAHDHIGQDGRAGLVGTNSVSQGKSRLAALDYVAHNQGVIHEAISSQPWSGEANVHVSIVNWRKQPSSPNPFSHGEKGDKTRDSELGKILPDISELAGIQRRIPEALLLKARELREKQTPAEEILWQCLRSRRLEGIKFRRQHNIGQFIADFYCHEARLVIELDGRIHDDQKEHDEDRDLWMQSNGFTVLRFKNEAILNHLETVLATILQATLTPSPSPAGEGDNSELPSPRGRRVGDEGQYYLDNKPVPFINSALTAETDVSQSKRLQANRNQCFQGVIPVGKGFLISEEQVNSWIQADSKNKDVLKHFSMGANLAQEPDGLPDRWIIDFNDLSIEEASIYELPFNHVKTVVKPERENNRREVTRINWWKYGEKRPAMRKVIKALSCYLTVPRVSKWAIFIFVPLEWLPGDKSVVLGTDDFYIFGMLISDVHRTWMHAQKSTLEDRIAYTHNTCFETFPFPQTPSAKIVQQIRAKALELHQYRSDQMQQKQWGITKLYNAYFAEPASQLYKLHKQLDAIVLQAYSFAPTDDLLEKLLELNHAIAAKEQRGDRVIGPWDPTQSA